MKQSACMRDAVHPLSPIPVVICRMRLSAISLPREAKSTAFGIARSALLCNNIDIKSPVGRYVKDSSLVIFPYLMWRCYCIWRGVPPPAVPLMLSPDQIVRMSTDSITVCRERTDFRWKILFISTCVIYRMGRRQHRFNLAWAHWQRAFVEPGL